MAKQWYREDVKDILKQLDTDAAAGLDPTAARGILRKEGANDVYHVTHASGMSYAAQIIFDFGTILLMLTVALAAATDTMTDAAVIFALLVISTAIEVFTYIGAQRVLEDAAHFCIPRTRVLRAGKLIDIDAAGVVRGDILILGQGDSVPCDCRILSSSRLKVSERGITDNSGAVFKNHIALDGDILLPPDKQTNMLFAGSTVIEGECRAVAVETGTDTLVCAMHGGISPATHRRLPLLKSLKNYCRTVNLIMTAAVITLCVLDMIFHFSGMSIDKVFIISLALAVASMTEFFVSLGYIAVAEAVKNTAGEDKPRSLFNIIFELFGLKGDEFKSGTLKNGAVIKNIANLPALCKVDCVVIRDCAVRTGMIDVACYYRDGKLYSREKKSEPLLMQLLSDAAYACLIDSPELPVNYTADGYDTEASMMLRLIRQLQKTTALKREGNVSVHSGITAGAENSMYRTALLVSDGNYTAVSISSVSRLLINCSTYNDQGKIKTLTAEMRADIIKIADKYEKESMLTFGIAKKPSIYNSLKRVSVLQSEMCFEGFFAVAEKRAENTEKSIAALKNASIRTVLINDAPQNITRYYAASLGIADVSVTPASAVDVAGMNDSDLDRLCAVQNTYCLLNSQDRLRVVNSLQRLGKTVAYIGEGREDTRVLSAANAAFACEIPSEDAGGYTYKSGAGTARTAADVLLRKPIFGKGGISDLFNTLTNVRTVYINLRNAAYYLISSQTARLFLVVCAMITRNETLTPVQILSWGLLADMFAVLSIVMQKSKNSVLDIKILSDKTLAERNKIINSVIFGLFTAAITFIGALLTEQIFKADGTFRSFVYAASILSPIVICAENAVNGSIFEKSTRMNVLFSVFSAICAVFFCNMVIFEKAAYVFGIISHQPLLFTTALTVPVLLLAAYEMFKFISLSRGGKKAEK